VDGRNLLERNVGKETTYGRKTEITKAKGKG